MSAHDKITIGADDFKGLVPDQKLEVPATGAGANAGTSAGSHDTSTTGVTPPKTAAEAANDTGPGSNLNPDGTYDINPHTNGHTGTHLPEHAQPAGAAGTHEVPIIGGTPDEVKHAAVNAGIITGGVVATAAGAYGLNQLRKNRKNRPTFDSDGNLNGEVINKLEDEDDEEEEARAEGILLRMDRQVNKDIRYLRDQNVTVTEINDMNDREIQEAARLLRKADQQQAV